tara:strand:- start:2052 stop:2453 length:402 start_codon:yes stop_codon:yes gene_type:complete
MNRFCFVIIGSICWIQCQTPEESVLGTFALDAEVGCTDCVELGPQTMRFDEDAPEGLLGGYRFEFGEDSYHQGHYEFVYLETSNILVLYPETASIEYSGLVGTTLQSEYRVGQNAIRERCNGLLDCVWRREDG